MKLFEFSKNKYGVELLMDIGSYADISNYFFESEIHYTDFYEIIFFNSGNGYIILDQQRIDIKENTVIFISPFQKRRWYVDSTKIDCYFLLFQDDFLSSFFADKLFTYRLQYFYNKFNPLTINVEAQLKNQLTDIFQELITELKQYQSDSEHIIRSLIYFILIKLNRVYASTYQLSSETETNNIAFGFKQLLQSKVLIHRDIAYYAQNLGVSRITLNKNIKDQFGITPSQMIDEFLLFEIKSRLMYTTHIVKEIADVLNFSEPNHLTRYFKRHTGMTPVEFRTTYQNGINLS
jgi:AraC-like DNA-binding protein